MHRFFLKYFPQDFCFPFKDKEKIQTKFRQIDSDHFMTLAKVSAPLSTEELK